MSHRVAFFNEQAKIGSIFVGTEGTFGLLPHGLEIYLGQNTNIEIKGYWPIKAQIPEEVLLKAEKEPTFFVFNQTQPEKVPAGWPIKLIAKYRKGVGDIYLQIYRVQI